MTHCEKVLALLSDGQPKTHHELYALGVIAHSRVSDLRRKGWRIACWTAKDRGETVSVYQLTGGPVSEGQDPGIDRGNGPSTLTHADAVASSCPSETGQLCLLGAVA